jgi:hypothetical protein
MMFFVVYHIPRDRGSLLKRQAGPVVASSGYTRALMVNITVYKNRHNQLFYFLIQQFGQPPSAPSFLSESLLTLQNTKPLVAWLFF